mmetsp:Transcript_6248/g.18144  ORF Transcript_6248/g.18144 Transcript_6248/m.18144 type:complete len:252 (-) Transcript_6248:94-849(-)
MSRLRALAAIIARADAGRPATASGAVSTFANAFVPSSTAFENAVDSAASSVWICSKRAFSAPSRPTPASSPLRISSSATRRCAVERAPHAASSSRRAHHPLCSAALPDSLEEKATTSGSTASAAERRSAESFTILRWPTAPHGPDTSSPSRSTESARWAYGGVSPRASVASTSRSRFSSAVCASARRVFIAGCTCSGRMSAKRGKSAGALSSGFSAASLDAIDAAAAVAAVERARTERGLPTAVLFSPKRI